MPAGVHGHWAGHALDESSEVDRVHAVNVFVRVHHEQRCFEVDL